MTHRTYARSRSIVLLAIVLGVVGPEPATAQISVEVTVPGHADPWLAGMPDGAVASCCLGTCDEAPLQSPQLAAGLCLEESDALSFEVTGVTAQDPYYPLLLPDGGPATIHNEYDENGIAALYAPISSCIGLFLDDTQPDQTPAPAGLDFGTPESRNYLVLTPALKQPFFIGDGRTSSGSVQLVVIPAGATRLFLGTMDSCEWNNNIGQLEVTVTDPCSSVGTEAATWSALKGLFR